MAKAERLVLVDGSWLVYRAFFAIPANLATKTGLPTNAIFGFATMFRKLFAGRMPDRGAVVFDSPAVTHRELRFPAYKAQRPAMPPELAQQLATIDRLVAVHRFPMLRKPGYEADDIIATLARRGAEAGLEVVIVAGDKDLAQMVGDHVRMLDTMRDVSYDAELVRKKWGVPPARIPDLLALVGDTVDNIPGVPGIGDKGAASLLEKYGSLDGILANLGELKGKQKAALEQHREAVKLYRELATVDTAAELDVTLDALRLTPPDPQELDALYRELEFYSLLSGGGAARVGDAPDIDVDVPATHDAARAALAALPAEQPVAVVPLFEPPARVHHAHLVGVALASDGRKPLYLAFRGQGAALGDPAIDLLRGLLADPTRPKFVHDIKQLAILCTRHGLALAGPIVDTMIASFLVDPVKCIPHALDQVAREYVQRSIPAAKSLLGSGQSTRSPGAVDIAAAAKYAAQLADVILALAPVLRRRLAEAGQVAHWEATSSTRSPTCSRAWSSPASASTATTSRAWARSSTPARPEIERRIYALAGQEFNIGSTKQLAEILFEKLKLPVIKKNKTGYSTDAEVLERLATKHEIARQILAQRELAKLINTYTDVLREAIAPETGRIHATFQQTTGVSGRLISTDPDLQRTPTRTPEGRRIRRAFVAPRGLPDPVRRLESDRAAGAGPLQQDPRLLEAFRDKLDLHRQTASLLFQVAPEAVTKEQRDIGKTVNFATIYGQGATALGQILGVPRKDAQSYIEKYFQHYSGVRQWLDKTIADAHASGHVTTLLGRVRHIPELSSRTDSDRAAGERIAANTPIQGSAADLCKLAMLQIDRGLPAVAPHARMLLQGPRRTRLRGPPRRGRRHPRVRPRRDGEALSPRRPARGQHRRRPQLGRRPLRPVQVQPHQGWLIFFDQHACSGGPSPPDGLAGASPNGYAPLYAP
jgi:DNA polymerase-1